VQTLWEPSRHEVPEILVEVFEGSRQGDGCTPPQLTSGDIRQCHYHRIEWTTFP
jgi:hypothetical protein